ncbi:hypothetical protein [Candidatus Allofournierella merdipullorum]|uniref:hypothetical protein n=1 Tax=Candidatus Allofournierella merdipullorum TaxID=2838595 RepID=UPI003AB81E44
MKQKLAALLTVAALALCALPMAVSAEGNVAKIGDKEYATLQEAVDAVTDNTPTTIKLLDNASGGGVIVPSNRSITFDLGGHTYTVSENTVGSSGTETTGFQLLRDSTVAFQNGKLTSTASTCQMLIQNYCNLTLLNVDLDGTALTGSQYVLSNNFGNTQITGSTSIKAPTGGVAFDVYYWPGGGYPGGVRVTVNTTGTITGKIEYTRDTTTNDQTAAENNVLTIVNVKHEGTFNVPVSGANITVSGGTFSNVVPADFLADGFAPTLNPSTGKYDVTKLPVVATVGGKDYYSLAEAATAAAATTEKTLTLKADATLDSMLTINTPGMVIDLGGFTVSASDKFQKDANNNNNHLVDITADNVTLKNGTLKAGANNNHTLNVWNAKGVQLSGLKLDNAASYGGAPLIVGASAVTVNDGLNVVTGANSWYGINVDSRNVGSVSNPNKGASITVAPNVSLVFEGQKSTGIYMENSAGMNGNDVKLGFGSGVTFNSSIPSFVPVVVATGDSATVTDPGNAGLQDNGNGTFSLKPAPTPKPEEPWTPSPTATPAPAQVLDSTPKTGAVGLAVLPLAGLAFAGLGFVTRKREE